MALVEEEAGPAADAAIGIPAAAAKAARDTVAAAVEVEGLAG